jgi:hypothetical protein
MTRGRDQASLDIFDNIDAICREWKIATRVLTSRYR